VSTPPADWYPDPEVPGQMRYWDGSAWTQHRHNLRLNELRHPRLRRLKLP
jgi:hypothetical protein